MGTSYLYSLFEKEEIKMKFKYKGSAVKEP